MWSLVGFTWRFFLLPYFVCPFDLTLCLCHRLIFKEIDVISPIWLTFSLSKNLSLSPLSFSLCS